MERSSEGPSPTDQMTKSPRFPKRGEAPDHYGRNRKGSLGNIIQPAKGIEDTGLRILAPD